MDPDRASLENPIYECLSPEQLVAENIKALMKARGVTRAVLSKRLNDLGFTTWRHEKTLRNLFDGKRSIRVNELFGFAAALNTTTSTLTGLDTKRAIYTKPKGRRFEICLGSSILGRWQYLHLWFGSPGAEVPRDHVSWADWEPGREPLWVSSFERQKDHVVQLYELQGWDLPAPADELGPRDLSYMNRRLRTISEELEE